MERVGSLSIFSLACCISVTAGYFCVMRTNYFTRGIEENRKAPPIALTVLKSDCLFRCNVKLSCALAFFRSDNGQCQLVDHRRDQKNKGHPLWRRWYKVTTSQTPCCPSPQMVVGADAAHADGIAVYTCRRGLATSGIQRISVCQNYANWTPVDIKCTNVTNCKMKSADARWMYSGRLSKTEDGTPCQRWDALYPHIPFEFRRKDVPVVFMTGTGNETFAEAANYCRDPAETPCDCLWCYTTDPRKRWQKCDVPTC